MPSFGLLFYLLFISILELILLIINKGWRKLFPPLVFLWGEQITVNNRLAKLRGNIFWCVIVALIIGIVLAFLNNAIHL